MNGRFKGLISGAICALIIIASLVSCNGEPQADTNKGDWRPNNIATSVSSDSLYVKKVEGLPEDFILGMDASCVPALEESGVKYYDHEGKEKDVYAILAENGINYIRVRVWNDPYNSSGKGYKVKMSIIST